MCIHDNWLLHMPRLRRTPVGLCSCMQDACFFALVQPTTQCTSEGGEASAVPALALRMAKPGLQYPMSTSSCSFRLMSRMLHTLPIPARTVACLNPVAATMQLSYHFPMHEQFILAQSPMHDRSICPAVPQCACMNAGCHASHAGASKELSSTLGAASSRASLAIATSSQGLHGATMRDTTGPAPGLLIYISRCHILHARVSCCCCSSILRCTPAVLC